MKCEAVTCKHNKLENSLYGYCQKQYPRLETIQDPVIYEETTGKCLDYQKRKPKGEYFVDYDEETESYCVFHTDIKQGIAFSSWASPQQAEKDAEERNNRKEVE